MKTIFLLRHGKAESRDSTESDFDRKLVKKGVRLTESVAKVMKSRGMLPELTISSPAPRAYETARVFARTVGIPENDIRTEQSIYDQKVSVIFTIVSDLDDNLDSVMLVGHDPSFSHMARWFAPEFRTSMPKSSIIAVEFDSISWRDVPESTGRLAAFEQPGE